jgi:hypothetical protein
MWRTVAAATCIPPKKSSAISPMVRTRSRRASAKLLKPSSTSRRRFLLRHLRQSLRRRLTGFAYAPANKPELVPPNVAALEETHVSLLSMPTAEGGTDRPNIEEHFPRAVLCSTLNRNKAVFRIPVRPAAISVRNEAAAANFLGYPKRNLERFRNQRVSRALAHELSIRGAIDFGKALMDASFAPAKKGRKVGKRKRGNGTKIMAVADRNGLPISACAESAIPHEVRLAMSTLLQMVVPNGPAELDR